MGKRYTIRPERSVALGFVRRNRPRTLWALREIDLDLAAGEFLAIIGRNGAGKSTLLKLAAGVTRLSEGRLRRPRFIAPLIEVGAGFHPELTGRENVEVNGRLLGLNASQIRRRFDDIVAFAEMEHAVDQPVKQYSSGMFMRLGFAVAVHTDPELLVVDEVLAVGDLPFQARCLEKIRSMRDSGVGILFVSHNLAAVLAFADRGLLLDEGRAVREGPVDEVIGAYHQLLAGDPGSVGLSEHAPSSGQLLLELGQVRRADGAVPDLWMPGDRVIAPFRLTAQSDTPACLLGVRLVGQGGTLLCRWSPEDAARLEPLDAGEMREMELELSLNVLEGSYDLEVAVVAHDWTTVVVGMTRLHRFGVGARKGAVGTVDISPALRAV
jgi:ABC-type polysaccharide/polyol phosphate transport system ATPase subunit